MSILTRQKILAEIQAGTIVIDPFNPDLVGPNSIDLRLGSRLLVYSTGTFNRAWAEHLESSGSPDMKAQAYLDMARENVTHAVVMDDNGLILEPDLLYLGHTMEWTETHKHLPTLETRSSVARLGMQVHATAGFGDVGFCGDWTLEITVKHRLKVYPGIPVCQLCYNTVEGEITPYTGKYQRQRGPKPSRMWVDYQKMVQKKTEQNHATENQPGEGDLPDRFQ